MFQKIYQKYRTISVNAIASFLQVIVVGIVYFFLYKYLLNHLGAKELGLWSLIVASTSVANIGSMGIGGSVVKFVAASDSTKDFRRITAIVHTGLFTVLPIIGSLVIVLYFLLPKLLVSVVSPQLWPLALQLIPICLLNFLLGACAGIFSSTIDGIQFIYIRNFIASALTILYLILVIFLAPVFGLIGVVYAQIAQTSLMILSYLIVVYIKIPGFSIIRLKISRSVFKELFGYGVNFQIMSLSILFFDPITKYFLSKFGGLSIVGYYEMANKLISQLRAMIVSSLQVIVPAIANVYAKGFSNVRGLYVKWFPYLFLGTLILVTYVISLAGYISIIWIGKLERVFVVILVLISFGWLFNIISTLVYFIYLGIGKLRWNVISHIVMALANLLFCYLFGRMFGGYYALLGTVVSLVLGALILLFAFNNEYGIKWKELLTWKSLRFFCLAIAAVGLSYFLFEMVNVVMPLLLLFIINILFISVLFFFSLWKSEFLYLPKGGIAGIKRN